MRRLSFNELLIADFKSFRGEHILKLDEHGVGVHFLSGVNKLDDLGSNGAGKSTVWHALSWCLFGRTPNNLRNPDIAPWKHKGKSRCVLKFTLQGDEHELERITRPNRLILDGKDIAQDAVDQLLGFGFDVFTHTILFSEGQEMFFDMQPRQKMQLLSDVMGLDKWDVYSEKASSVVKEILDDINMYRTRVKGYADQSKMLLANIKRTKLRMDVWNSDRSDNLRRLDDALEAAKIEAASLSRLVSESDVDYDWYATELKAIDRALNELSNESLNLSKKISRNYARRKSLKQQIASAENELATLEQDGKCPLCGSMVSGDRHGKTTKRKITALKNELREVQVDELKKQLAVVDARRIAQEKARKSFTKNSQTNYETFQRNRADLSVLESKIKTIGSQIKEVDAAVNPHAETVKAMRHERRDILELQDTCSDKIRMLQRRLERTQYWVQGFKQVRLQLINEALQELEFVANDMIGELGLVGWSIKFEVEKETKKGSVKPGLTVFVKSPHNTSPVKWDSWSGGEKGRLRLIGSLSFAEILLANAGVKVNLEVLDEPTNRLSEEGVRDLGPFLMDRAKRVSKQIWLVDHTTVESANFLSVVKIIRDQSGSRFA